MMNTIKNLLVLAVTVFMIGCGGETAPAPSTPSTASTPAPNTSEPAEIDPALIAEGKTLFDGTAICFTCHGAGGVGSTLAPNLTDAEWLNIEAPVTLDKLKMVIKNGVTEPRQFAAPMPAMGHLSDDQITAVATYVMSLGS